MLEVAALSYTHPGQQTPLFSDLSLSFTKGSLVCLTGVNGSGKSTLLSLLAGLLPTPHGTFVWHENTQSISLSSHALRERTSLVLHDADMQIVGATPEEDILLTAEMLRKKPQSLNSCGEPPQQCSQRYLQRFQLDKVKDAPVQTLSFGQKRKLCLASALMTSPDVLLLDEPLSGLDYPAVQELLALLHECLATGMIIIVSTHDLLSFVPCCEAMLLLHPTLPPSFTSFNEALPLLASYQVKPLL